MVECMGAQKLHAEIFHLLAADDAAAALALLEQTKPQWQGRALGTWHYLYALVIRRCRPDDRAAFTEACRAAARLLPSDHAGLCMVYLAQLTSFMTWGEWQNARTYIRRIRSMVRRRPSDYELIRIEGMVLINEGLVERAEGNFARAADLLLHGITVMERHLYPVEENTRKGITAMALLEAADCFVRLGQHGKAVQYLSKVDLDQVPLRESGKYFYVYSRFWLALGVIERAEEWLENAREKSSWDPDWPVLLLEVQAGIARLRGDMAACRSCLEQAAALAGQGTNSVLTSLLRLEITRLKGE